MESDEKIEHIKKVLAHPIETDEDYLRLVDLTEDESDEPATDDVS